MHDLAQAAQQVDDAVDAARVAAIATIMVAVITAAGIVIAAYVARGTRRAFRRVAEETAESLDTHNGKSLAAYVMDIAEKLNLQADSLTRMHEMQNVMADRQLDMKLRLDTHIEESEPIRDYVTELKARDAAALAGEIDRRESEEQ